MLHKKWTIADEPDKEFVAQFSRETNIPFTLSKILINRGITSKALARKFFIPEMCQLHDPFLMKDLSKAVDRLLQVINNKEKILVFGDYDVDGTSGVSMFRIFLNKFNVPSKVFIPDRFTDGYGLSKSGIEHAVKEGIKLIIAIDCGITANDKVDYAKQHGIDVIICDHHQPPEKLPDAYAILDTLQQGCEYPFKYLCGTGVAFKLIQGLCNRLNVDYYADLLDFAAIATAADMVPITDENRVILHFGFKQIVERPRPSFLTLIRNSGFKLENLTTSSIVFSLGPRINAVGRLGDATRAVEFLTCDDYSKVEDLAGILESENINRRKIDSEIYQEAQNLYEAYKNESDIDNKDVAIILYNENWHPGVLGIIASRMVEKYYKPAIILTLFNGHAKGSARSVNNFNIYDALKSTSEQFDGLVQFGGHYHAAGLELEIGKVDEFRRVFNRVASEMMSRDSTQEDILTPEIKIDTELDIDEIDTRYVKILKHFEPFGPSNMTPIFLTNNLQIVGEPKVYNNTTHVFRVRKNVSSYPYTNDFFDCIYFNPQPEEANKIKLETGTVIDAVYSIDENHWNGKTKIQLKIRDFKIKDKF